MITGVLACLDGYMNIALENTEEYVNGQLKNSYGDTFIRGNNGKHLLAQIVLFRYTFWHSFAVLYISAAKSAWKR
jgi:hypothetical protein